MKTSHVLQNSWSKLCGQFRKRQRILSAVALFAAALGVIGFATNDREDYVAHEWGTFTSVQGADGALMDWRPFETPDLPKFVYDWSRPGLNRQGQSTFVKSSMITRQRMETPVIYFYTKETQNVDVTVKFPKGKITEWYPQAAQIGPAFVPPSALMTKLDVGAHKVGFNPEFTFASLLPRHAAKDSRIVWSNVEILPPEQYPDVSRLVPNDKSGGHYFAARETDSAFVRVDPLSRTNPAPQYEKYLFYRGVGNFSTPLHVTTDINSALTLTNTGDKPLSHLFVLQVRDGLGDFVALDALSPNTQCSLELNTDKSMLPLPDLARVLGKQMVDALVREGLYIREAQAMVNTWKDSWFTEEGVRILYTLPRAWTDETLPITLEPKPKELVRVMVGRAEVITPTMQAELARQITAAKTGDASAGQEVEKTLMRFGRFAEPALRLATDSAAPELRESAWKLFHAMNARGPEKRL